MACALPSHPDRPYLLSTQHSSFSPGFLTPHSQKSCHGSWPCALYCSHQSELIWHPNYTKSQRQETSLKTCSPSKAWIQVLSLKTSSLLPYSVPLKKLTQGPAVAQQGKTGTTNSKGAGWMSVCISSSGVGLEKLLHLSERFDRHNRHDHPTSKTTSDPSLLLAYTKLNKGHEIIYLHKPLPVSCQELSVYNGCLATFWGQPQGNWAIRRGQMKTRIWH